MKQSWRISMGLSCLALMCAINSSQANEFTPAVVWDHGAMIYEKCEIPDFDCVLRLMQSSGASPEAMAFLQREEAWVVEFTEYGQTDLLRLETFRANTNQYYALANAINLRLSGSACSSGGNPEVSRVSSYAERSGPV